MCVCVCVCVCVCEWLFNHTPARKTDRLLGVRTRYMHEMVYKLKIEKYYQPPPPKKTNNNKQTQCKAVQ